MTKGIAIILGGALLFITCKKLDKYTGNNVPYSDTTFSLNEEVTLTIPNSSFNFGGVGNCMSLGIFGPINYDAFVLTQNPNPYADLVYKITPKSIKMTLTNITTCDFSMLQNCEIYLTDNNISDPNNLILQDPNNLSQPYNAVKIGEFLNIPDGIGNTMNLDVNSQARLDQFIHAGTFNTYAKLSFDKAFTKSEAIIKTEMELDVTLINAK